MNPKELKKLIKLCRDMGVQSYKGDGFEFTLTAESPLKLAKRAQKQTNNHVQPEEIESDNLTPEQLLFYSALAPFEAMTAEGDK